MVIIAQANYSEEVEKGMLYALIFLAYLVLRTYLRYRRPYTNPYQMRLRPIGKSITRPLEQHFNYYQRLSAKDKKEFLRRVHYFISVKKFIPRNLDAVTDEMKALIAGSAIQLTFGLPDIHLSHFKYILVYPDDYYSTISRKYHRGEVNPARNAIVLSWKNFVQGYIESESGINLGLHEMAHALRLENRIHNHEYKFFDQQALKVYDRYSRIEIDKINAGQPSFFRKYAGENEDEFFAVAIENFFERPRDFRQEHPELYDALAKLLNQDPLKLFTYS